MSARVETCREARATAGDFPDDLWHIAADDHHDHRAENGLSWMTLCGQMRPPERESKDPYAAPDDCLVCVALEASR